MIRVAVNDQAFWRGDRDLGMPHPATLKGVTYFLIRLDEEALIHPNASGQLQDQRYKEESIGKWASGTRAERRIIRQQ